MVKLPNIGSDPDLNKTKQIHIRSFLVFLEHENCELGSWTDVIGQLAKTNIHQ